MSVVKDVHDIIKDEAKTPAGRWVLLHTLGGAIGAVLSAIMGVTFEGSANWGVFGITLGVIQILLLKEFRKLAILWILFSGLGWAIMAKFPIGNFIAPVITGFALGVLQGILIRTKRRRAYLWAVTNIIAWPIGGAIGLAVASEVTKRGVLGFDFVAGLACASFVASIFLWVALKNMPMKQPISSVVPEDVTNSDVEFKQFSSAEKNQTPLEIAKMRYAKGKITKKEFEELMEDLI